MSTGIHPLFKWFGSKWMSAKTLPPPQHDMIVEPFAGGAGYSLRHCEKKVILAETDPHLRFLWKWIIFDATSSNVLDIPINIAEGIDIRTLGLTLGQATLLKSWQRTNNVGDCWTISPWGNKPGQWTANTRARVAEEINVVRHWVFVDGSGVDYMLRARNMAATWLVDPPYEFNYQYRGKEKLDYTFLADACHGASGQVIVCEAVCPKTGSVPSWLPFKPFGSRITSRRKAENNHHSKELLWQSS